MIDFQMYVVIVINVHVINVHVIVIKVHVINVHVIVSYSVNVVVILVNIWGHLYHF